MQTLWLTALATVSSLLPLAAQEPRSLRELASDHGSFGTLLRAAEVAGLTDALENEGPFTLLAPTDAAFAALPEADLAGLLADSRALARVLRAHLLPGRHPAQELVGRGSAVTLDGVTWTVRIADGRVAVGDAPVVAQDLAASNGTIHALDRVLVPPATPTAPRSWAGEEVVEWRARAQQAADVLEAALDEEGDLRDAVRSAAELLDGSRAAARLRGLTEESQEDAIASACERIVSDLRFRPYVEAELPVGFPEPAPVGEVVLKSYPQYRMARTETGSRSGMNSSFWRLFQHIKKHEIAMTAPVQIDYDAADAAARRTESMAFLYAKPDMGQVGPDQQVRVLDVEPMLAISIGGRGYETGAIIASLRAELDAFLARHGEHLEVAGPMRTMGYNSPMVPPSRRFFEVEIPVRMR